MTTHRQQQRQKPEAPAPPSPTAPSPGAYRIQWRPNMLKRVLDAFSKQQGVGHPNLLARINAALWKDGGVYDWYVITDVPPPDQKEFVEEVMWPVTTEIIGREAELGRKFRRTLLRQAAQIFEAGAVHNPADPTAAAKQISALKSRLEQLLIVRQSALATKNVVIALFLSGLVAWAGYYMHARSTSLGGVELANFFYVASSCLAVDAVMTRGLVKAETIIEYEKRRHVLEAPILRLITLAIAVEFFAILCWKGGLQLKVGSLVLQKLDSDPFVAIVLGAAGGVLGSDLVKLLVNFIRRSVGRDASGRRSGGGSGRSAG